MCSRATKNQLFGSSAHWKFATSFTISKVRKLGQSTLLVKVDFKGLTSAVAFADFFTSVMAFTPNWHSRLPGWRPWPPSRQLRSLIMLKTAPNQADNFANFVEMSLSKNQLFGSSAGSDLQAINIAAVKKNCCVSLLFYWTKYILFMTIVVLSLFS